MSKRDVPVLAAIWIPVLGATIVLDVNPALAGFVGMCLTYGYLDEREEETEEREEPAARPERNCPQCGDNVRRAATMCPDCFTSLTPWTFHAGFWWAGTGQADWQWLDEGAGVWRWYDDGTPSSPFVTAATPDRVPDPAPADSRAVDRSSNVGIAMTQSSGGSA